MRALSAARWTLVLSIVLVATKSYTYAVSKSSSSETASNYQTEDYWAEDRPYVYQPHWTRLSSGKAVPTNGAAVTTSANYHDAVKAEVPWISSWVLSTQGRRTLKKDIPRLLMYNLVSPMDYGSSLRSNNVRRRRNKAIGMFVTDNVALPLLKSLGRVAWNLIKSHYVGYIEGELFVQRLKMMNASEMVQAFNLTMPTDAAIPTKDEGFGPNRTRSFVYDGGSKRVLLYAHYSGAFSPYEGYSDKYYTRDDKFPMPAVPADSYPWLWSLRLDFTRIVASQLMQSLGIGEESIDDVDDGSESNAGTDSCLSSCASFSDGLLEQSSFSPNNVSTSTSGSVDAAMLNRSMHEEDYVSAHDIQALEQIHLQLQEFYFETGIPRFANHSKVPRSLFPSQAVFLSTSLTSSAGASGSGSSTTGSYAVAGISSTPAENFGDGINDSATDFSTRHGVYAALIAFYAYPSFDEWVLNGFDIGNKSIPCMVQSGVTVYTPLLTTLTLFQTLANTSVSPATKQKDRLHALLEIASVSFEAERRALSHGLQGPSTVWYSNYDLDVDEFADAVLGTVNLSIRGNTGGSVPLHVFESFMNDEVPVLDEMVSYYAATSRHSKIIMESNHTSPVLNKFEESELAVLIESFEAQMESLDRSIDSYVQTRAANPQYQEVVNATIRGDLYNGSEYSLLGFGFVIMATNDMNVLYRDMKLPVPFHLVMRLIVRFQESCLLLPIESRQLLVCLAMAVNHLSFYRCRTQSSSSDN